MHRDGAEGDLKVSSNMHTNLGAFVPDQMQSSNPKLTIVEQTSNHRFVVSFSLPNRPRSPSCLRKADFGDFYPDGLILLDLLIMRSKSPVVKTLFAMPFSFV